MTAPNLRNLKDALTANDFAAENGGGLLSPAQFDHFFTKTRKEAKLLGDCRVEYMDSPQKEISIGDIAGRILHRPANGAQRLDPSLEFKMTPKTLTLQSHLMKAKILLTDDTREDQIARGTLDEYILGIATQQVGLDMEETGLCGDTQSIDYDTAILDGFMVQVPTAQTIDYTSNPQDITSDVFLAGLDAIAPKYLKNPGDCRFYLSRRAWQAHVAKIAEKNTPLADLYLTKSPMELPILGVPYFILDTIPDDVYLLTFKQNLCYGIQRKVNVEKFRDPDYGTSYHITVRFDAKILDTDGVILFKGLKTSVTHTA